MIEAPPDRVYDAFLDPDALAEWFPPSGVSAEVHDLDPVVSGSFRITFSFEAHDAARALADGLPDAQHRTLAGQDHDVSPAALAPVLSRSSRAESAGRSRPVLERVRSGGYSAAIETV